MRHGQADNNVNRILVGRSMESHLTEFGKKQVTDTANHLKNLPIDKVLVSPVMRTIETADIVCNILGISYDIDDRLFELDLGKLIGMNYEDIVQKYGNLFLKFYTEDGALQDLGVESFSSVKKRVKSLLDEINSRYEHENILMITHLDPIKAAVSLILELNPDAIYRWHMRNAALTILKRESNIYSITGVNVMGMHRYLDE